MFYGNSIKVRLIINLSIVCPNSKLIKFPAQNSRVKQDCEGIQATVAKNMPFCGESIFLIDLLSRGVNFEHQGYSVVIE